MQTQKPGMGRRTAHDVFRKRECLALSEEVRFTVVCGALKVRRIFMGSRWLSPYGFLLTSGWGCTPIRHWSCFFVFWAAGKGRFGDIFGLLHWSDSTSVERHATPALTLYTLRYL